MTKKKSKNKKVLAASMILAAMIVASSSFAWFTSKDEVVNKLSAQNHYAVTITEDFTPPTQWLPGQIVKKEAGAINTGNIAAFVKLTLSNTLKLTTYDTPEEFNAANTAKYVELKPNEVTSLEAGGQKVYDKDGLVIYNRSSDSTPKYVGYYSHDDKNYALAEITHTPTNPESGTPESFSAKLQTEKTDEVTPALTYVPANNKIVATAGSGDKQIVINIKLDTANWTNAADTTEFYYNKILEAGTETGKLVQSVELDKSVKNDAYVDMDYELKLTADSVQVTTDDDKTTAVNEQGWTLKAAVSGDNVTWTPAP